MDKKILGLAICLLLLLISILVFEKALAPITPEFIFLSIGLHLPIALILFICLRSLWLRNITLLRVLSIGFLGLNIFLTIWKIQDAMNVLGR